MCTSIRNRFFMGLLALSVSLLSYTSNAQTVEVSGLCITDTISLIPGVDPSMIDGKIWYAGSGTVLGFANVIVSVYWSAVDSRWFLAFDGQPYFESAANTALPPNTGSGNWVPTVDNMDCTAGGAGPLGIAGSGTTTSTSSPGTARLQLAQNQPNPFKGNTAIGFELPAACEAQLRVFDINGRELLRTNNAYPAGYNSETLRLESVTASGVLTCVLVTPFGAVTRRIVKAN